MKGNDKERILEYYLLDKKLIHVSCNDGRFYNGKILEINSKKQLMVFIDDKLGEIPILFEEIKHVEPFREEGR